MTTNKKIILRLTTQYNEIETSILNNLQKEIYNICLRYKISFLIIYKEYEQVKGIIFKNYTDAKYDRLFDGNDELISILNMLPVQMLHKLKNIKQLIIK